MDISHRVKRSLVGLDDELHESSFGRPRLTSCDHSYLDITGNFVYLLQIMFASSDVSIERKHCITPYIEAG